MSFLKTKVFKRIFINYSAVIIVSMTIFSLFVFRSIIVTSKSNQLYLTDKLTKSMKSEFEKQYDTSKEIVNLLYSRSTEINDTINFLDMNYDEYIKRRLDAYYTSTESAFPSVHTFVRNSFLTYGNIESIILYSNNRDNFYIFQPTGKMNIIYAASRIGKVKTNKENMDDYVIKLLKNVSSDDALLNNYTINDIKDPYTLKSAGKIIINYKLNSLDKIIDNYKIAQSSVIVMESEGSVVYDSTNTYNGKMYPYFSKIKPTGSLVNLGQYSYIDVTNTESGKIIVGILPVGKVLFVSKALLITTFIITILLIVLGEMWSYNKIKSLSKRIYHINSAIEKVQSGDFKTRIELDNDDDEISIISRNLNQMCERLEEYINKVYLMEINQKNAEMRALQNQINPHFLYNTLESIRMKAITNNDPDVGKMLYNLATLFRMMVKAKTYIPLEQELKYCELFLELFKFRYDNKFDYCIDADKETLNKEIIKFTLQPIIENFIIHGIRLEDNDNFLLIAVEKDETNIKIFIEDNGKGVTKEETDILNAKISEKEHNVSSIGLANVNERIQIHYGENYGVEIEEKNTDGFKVIITIPCREVNDFV